MYREKELKSFFQFWLNYAPFYISYGNFFFASYQDDLQIIIILDEGQGHT